MARERAGKLLQVGRDGGSVIPEFQADLCTDCGGCVGVCPVDAVELIGGHVDITQACIECDLCVRACPTGALTSDTFGGSSSPSSSSSSSSEGQG